MAPHPSRELFLSVVVSVSELGDPTTTPTLTLTE